MIVEGFDSRIQLRLVAEGHESESLGLPGFAVGDDFYPFDRSKCGKEVRNFSFSSSVGQVAHVDIHCISVLITPIHSTLPQTAASEIQLSALTLPDGL